MPAKRDTSIMGLVLSYTRLVEAALATVRNKQPAYGTQPESELAYRQSPQAWTKPRIPTIAGCDDPILPESLLRYRIPDRSLCDRRE